MTPVKLSERMKTVAGMVTHGSRLADVGCDHAFIPIRLCQEGSIPSAIALDIKNGPLERAREHVASYALEDRIETRRSDGLENLGEDEADTVLIAGMGGLLMKRILTEHAIPDSVSELVLQPQSEIGEVRRCVRELGFSVADEDMVLEDGKFYPVMRARRRAKEPGERPETDGPDKGQAGSDPGNARRLEMEDAFGPVLLRDRNPVLRQWIGQELAATDRILAHLEKETDRGDPVENIRRRRQELEHKRELLLEASEEMNDS